MNYKKEIKYINKLLIDLYDCEDVDIFYQLSTKLYYHINCIVFGLETLKNEDNII